MKAIAEFRIDEEFASLLFKSDEGERLGDSVRKILISTQDPRYSEIGVLQQKLRQTHGRPFFYGWNIRRHYSKKELDDASLFKLRVLECFEPAGEECGTKYDEFRACPQCGAGAAQSSQLFLDTSRIPNRKDIACTIAGEIVISQRVVDISRGNEIIGADFEALFQCATQARSKDWYQLCVSASTAEIVSPTRAGVDPFDEDANVKSGCPRGDLLGVSLLSEVWLRRSSYVGTDMVKSVQYVGVRRGLLRPRNILFISQRLRRIFEENQVKGLELEVAHLV